MNVITFMWRQIDEKEQWILTVILPNPNECLGMITNHLQRKGLNLNKGYQRKKKILESEVTKDKMKAVEIESLTA